MDKATTPSDPLSPSHQIALALQVEVGEVENPPIDLSPSPPTPLTQNFSAKLECGSDGCDEVLYPCPPSFAHYDSPYFDVLCSTVSHFSSDVHKDQVLDGVGVEKPTCDIIFDEYVWESKQESVVKDDLLFFAPLLHYPDIYHDSTIFVQSCQNSFLDVYTFDHSQNTWNASFSFECEEEKFVFPDPLISDLIFLVT